MHTNGRIKLPIGIPKRPGPELFTDPDPEYKLPRRSIMIGFCSMTALIFGASFLRARRKSLRDLEVSPDILQSDIETGRRVATKAFLYATALSTSVMAGGTLLVSEMLGVHSVEDFNQKMEVAVPVLLDPLTSTIEGWFKSLDVPKPHGTVGREKARTAASASTQ